MQYIFLFLALILNSCANILIKVGAQKSGSLLEANGIIQKIFYLIKNPYLIFGIFFFASNIIFYFMALKKIKLSIAYPIMSSGGFLIISIASIILFKENFDIYQVLGILFIILGILLVSINFT